jgi:DNA-binding XRE family transcriptional regulator
MSQEELAHQAEVSVRHLSFVETGRSSPSRELVIALACALGVEDVGLFLEGAGFLAPYPDLDLSTPAMASFVKAMRDVVDRQPLPALVHDRFGTIQCYNQKLAETVASLGVDAGVEGPASGHRLLEALRPLVTNWEEVAALYRRRLFRELVRGGGEVADELLEELYRALEVPDASPDDPPQLLCALVLEHDGQTLRFDFVTATFGTPQDIALRNYRMVIFLPADEATRRVLEAPIS